MTKEIPLVRYWLACEAIFVDDQRKSVSLLNLFHAIKRLTGESFPCTCEKFAMYGLFTNGRGKHALSLGLACWEQGEEQLLFRSRTRIIDFGADPTLAHGLPIPLNHVSFPQAGS